MIKCCVRLNNAKAIGKSCCRKIHGSLCEAEKHYLEKLAVYCRGIRLNCFVEIGQRKNATYYQCSNQYSMIWILSWKSTSTSLSLGMEEHMRPNLAKNWVHFGSFMPITLNQLAFGSLNANQQYTKSVYLQNKPCYGSSSDPF